MSGLVTLADLSTAARTGFRGANAAAFLAAQGLELPAVPNRAVIQADGCLVLRLSLREFWILAAEPAQTVRIDTLHALPTGEGCYPLFCRDSHDWYVLGGEQRAACMAKLCAVDLRTAAFPEGSIAQTVVARLNAVVVHHRHQGRACFSLLCDSAAGGYMRDALADAMAEFGAQGVWS